MNGKKRSVVTSFRVLLPVGIFAVLLMVMGLSLHGTISTREAVMRAAVEQLHLSDLARLARNAELLFESAPKLLRENFSRLPTNPDLRAALLTDSSGRIIFSSKFEWRGQQANLVVQPHFTPLLERARKTRSAIIHDLPATDQLALVMSFAVPDSRRLRSLERGVIYLLVDLADRRLEARRGAVAERLPDLIAIFFGALVLMRILDRQVNKPLDTLRQAVANVPGSEFHSPVIPEGAHEIRDLTNAFNSMSEQLQDQLSRLTSQASFVRAVLDSTGDGIVLINQAAKITLLNPVAESIFGAAPENSGALGLKELFPDDDLSFGDFESGLYREVRGRHRDGTIIPLEVTVARIDFEERKQLVIVVRDIARRKQVEENLIQAQREAERANLAKSDFLASMSHELRTPLNAVLGYCQLLTKTPEMPDNAVLQVAEIESAGGHLLSLVSDLIDLSLIEADKLKLNMGPASLRSIVNESVTMTSSLARNSGTRIELGLSSVRDIVIHADRSRARQILINLLSNAIKYGPDGGVVFVSAVVQDGLTRLSVTDSGPGIPVAQQARIFHHSFERLGRERGTIEGVGIGLVICYRLARAMGGDVGFFSSPGIGSTFWVEFRASSSTELQAESVAPVAEDDVLMPVTFPGARILLAEDNPINQRMTSLILSRFGCEHDLVVNGQEALAKAMSGDYDLVLMDCQMPVMDGYEATLAIRKAEQTTSRPRLPIVAITANAMESDREQCIAVGMDDYIAKPIQIDMLRGLLLKWLPEQSSH